MNYVFDQNDFIDVEMNESLKLSFSKIIDDKKNIIDNDFFYQIFEILLRYTGNCREKIFTKIDGNFFLIKDCIYIAKYFFNKGVNEKSINEIILAVIIIDYFSQDFDILEIKKNNEKLNNLLTDVLESFVINVKLPKDAPYNEKKMFEVYANAKKTNEYSNVISIIENLMFHSRIFDSFEYTWKIVIQFAFFVDRNIIFSILVQESSFEKIDFFLSSIHVIDLFSEIIKTDNNYLIIRSTKYFFEELEKEFVRNEKIDKDYTDIIATLFSNEQLVVKKYIKASRIQYFQSYCYLMGWLLTKKEDFINDYLETICFSDNQANSFSSGFNFHLTDNTDGKLVFKIEKCFFESEIKSFSPVNFYSGFIDLFTYNYASSYSSRELFLNELKKCSDKIIAIQNSWNFDNLQKSWVRLFYLTLSTIYTDFFFTEEEIKKYVPVLFDNRNKIIQGKENIQFMISMLENHSQYLRIKLYNSAKDEIIFEINKKV